MKFFKKFLNKKIFGVCSYFSDIVGLDSSVIRLIFIYSLFTNIFSLSIYILFLFFINLKKYSRINYIISLFS
ncbi:MAG: PspC family transcriptional regulator [Flavobacteriales bacterium]|nr:PspC family transcriptional regulator [Flavobacteriales bacterium]